MERELGQSRNTTLLALAGVAALSIATFVLIGPNYLLFHTLVELMGAVIALAVFVIAWHTRSFASSDYVTLIGLAYLPVGVVTVLHALAFRGMPVIPGSDANLATQLWLIARALQASAFLIAPLFLARRMKHPAAWLTMYCVVAGAATFAAFAGVFPVAFVEGQGLTPFKVTFEYVVIGITLVGASGLYHGRDDIDHGVALMLWSSMAFTIVAEVAFTVYAEPYGLANRIGHVAHVAAFLLVYAALVDSSLERPIETLFHQLKKTRLQLADTYATEHKIAETYQLAMAIQPEIVPGLRFAHRYQAAPGAGRIGGDFYDLFQLHDRLIGFAIGDVCGKGLKAAMTTMKVRSALRSVALGESDPARVLETVNSYLHRELASDSFVTAVFGTIDADTGQVRVAVAGHPAPVVCGRDEVVLRDELRAPPLGVREVLGAEVWEFNLRRGDTLVLVTDGVLEAGGAQHQFGTDRLLALLHALPHSIDAEQVVDAVIAAVGEHNKLQQDDDVAVIALHRC